MTWDNYKNHIKATDPISYEILNEAELEADIISAIIHQRNELGLSQRDLAAICNIPQSSVARIESLETMPRLDTLLKILSKLGLTLSVSPMMPTK